MRVMSRYLSVVMSSLLVGPVAHAEWHVWTVTETRHVLRSELPGSEAAVRIAAARNEWVSFQILRARMSPSGVFAWKRATCVDREKRCCVPRRPGSIASISFIWKWAPIATMPSSRTGTRTH